MSSLTVSQLLRKDLKVVNFASVEKGIAKNIVIAMSSVMMSAETLYQKDGFDDEICKFLDSKNSTFCFVMGAVIDPLTGSIKRDILIYPITITSARKLAEKLRQWPELKLEKVILAERSFEVFRQADASFSRKKILPIIKNIFSDLKIYT